jgi:hypothetical protein
VKRKTVRVRERYPGRFKTLFVLPLACADCSGHVGCLEYVGWLPAGLPAVDSVCIPGMPAEDLARSCRSGVHLDTEVGRLTYGYDEDALAVHYLPTLLDPEETDEEGIALVLSLLRARGWHDGVTGDPAALWAKHTCEEDDGEGEA